MSADQVKSTTPKEEEGSCEKQEEEDQPQQQPAEVEEETPAGNNEATPAEPVDLQPTFSGAGDWDDLEQSHKAEEPAAPSAEPIAPANEPEEDELSDDGITEQVGAGRRLYRVYQIKTTLDGEYNTFDTNKIECARGDAVEITWRDEEGQRVIQTDSMYQPLMSVDKEEWLVHRAASKDPDNFKGTRTHVFRFDKTGTYYFASSKERLRGFGSTLKVNVASTHGYHGLGGLKWVILGVIAFLALLASILAALFVVDSKVLLIPPGSEADSESYEGRRELQTMLMRYTLGWWIFGLIVFIGWIIAWFVSACTTNYLADYGKGYHARYHNMVQGWMYLVGVSLVACVLGFWWVTIEVDEEFGSFFESISLNALSTLNDIGITIQNVEFLIVQIPILFKTVPITGAQTFIDQVLEISDLVSLIATYGDDAVRGMLRVLAILTFLALQFTLLGAAMGLVGLYRRRSAAVRSAVWIICMSLVFTSFALGITFLGQKVVERSLDALTKFEDDTLTAGSLQRATGLEEDAPLMSMFAVCLDDDFLSVDFIYGSLSGISSEFNDIAATAGADAGLRLPSAVNLTNVSLATLANYSANITAALSTIDSAVAENATALYNATTEYQSKTAPILRSLMVVERSATSLMRCRMIRLTLTDAIPHLGLVNDNLKLQIRVHLAIFAIHIVFIVGGIMAAYVFDRPYKQYVCPASKRAFIFPWSYRAHITVLDQHRAASEAKGKPFRVKPQKVKEPCTFLGTVSAVYSANLFNAMLVFFQSLLLLLLHVTFPENKLATTLQVVCLFCAVIPVASFLSELGNLIGVRIIFRFFALILSVAALWLCFVTARSDILDANECLDKYLESRDSAQAVNDTTYPFQQECQMDVVLRKVESSVYSTMIGIVLLVAALTSLLLLMCSRWSQHSYELEEVKSLLDPERVGFLGLLREIRRRKQRKNRTLCILVVFLLVLAAAGAAFVFTFVIGDALGGEEETGADRYFTVPNVGCNGHVGLCAKRLDEVVWMATNNAMSSATGEFLTPYHFHGVTTQMEHGVRAFNFKLFPTPSAVSGLPVLQCRSACNLGSYEFSDDLDRIKSFLDGNKSAVFILLLEESTSTVAIANAFTAANLTSLIWTSTTGSPVSNTSFQFPTLQELIDTDRRLLIFTDKATAAATAPFMHYIWDFFLATERQVKTSSQLKCTVAQGSGSDALSARKMSILHHHLSNPYGMPSLAAEANTFTSITGHFDNCTAEWGSNRLPNLVSVDYWTLKSPLETIDFLNKKYALTP